MHPFKKLDQLPQKRAAAETLDILRQLSKSSTVLGELKGIAKTIPNQAMLINTVALQEAKVYRKELIELLFEHPYSRIDYVVNRLGG